MLLSFFKNFLAILALLFCCNNVNGQYEDVRCKCTCLSYPKYNYKAQIYTKNVSHSHCNCLEVVLSDINPTVIPEADWEPYCLRCECKYEVRSTKTMQVVVYLFLVLIGLLTLYMIFMLVADPVINKVQENSDHRQLLEDDRTEMSTLSRASQASQFAMDQKNNTSASVFQLVNSVQNKWKKQVQEQRSNVFDRQEMLQ